jgi:hypothetical protein
MDTAFGEQATVQKRARIGLTIHASAKNLTSANQCGTSLQAMAHGNHNYDKTAFNSNSRYN